MRKSFRVLSAVLTAFAVFAMLSLAVSAAELSGSPLTVVDFSSEQQETESSNPWLAAYVVDGDPATTWSNTYSPEYAGPPHHVTIDLGAVYTVTGFKYLPRQDGWNGVENGDIGEYKVFVSTDGTTFTEAHSGEFTVFDASEQSATFAGVSGRYVKLVQEDQEWIAIAEMKIVVEDAATPTNPPTGDSGWMFPALLAAAGLAALVLFGRKAVFGRS